MKKFRIVLVVVATTAVAFAVPVLLSLLIHPAAAGCIQCGCGGPPCHY